MQKPKILISLFRFPYPAIDGTRYKILENVVAGLAIDFTIEFFIVTTDSVTKEQIAYLEKRFGNVYVFRHTKIGMLWNAMKAFCKGIPFQTGAFIFADAQKWIDYNIDTYDAIYIHEIRMSKYFTHYSDQQKKKMLLDFNDAISFHYQSSIRRLPFLKRLFYAFEGKRVRHYETKMLETFYNFNIVSEQDRDYILSAPYNSEEHEINFSCIHHGIAEANHTASLDDAAKNIFFLGKLDYEPNRDALVYFLEHIWISLKARNPDTVFYIIGKGKIPKKYYSYDGVIFTGFVRDLWTILSKCVLMVAPIRFAGGTPSKIIEAMSYGFPVVTTPIVSRGIEGLVHNENSILVPEIAIETWISSIEQVLNEQFFKKKIGDNAKQYVQQNYSASVARKAFRELFQTILNTSR